MLRAIPRMATAVATPPGPCTSSGREPFLVVAPGHVTSHRQLELMAEARLAFDAAGGGSTSPPPLAVVPTVSSGPGMESGP
jgi:hypothetical protein